MQDRVRSDTYFVRSIYNNEVINVIKNIFIIRLRLMANGRDNQ